LTVAATAPPGAPSSSNPALPMIYIITGLVTAAVVASTLTVLIITRYRRTFSNG
jgi:formate-dependent nitrite reductase membrane component NrfD